MFRIYCRYKCVRVWFLLRVVDQTDAAKEKAEAQMDGSVRRPGGRLLDLVDETKTRALLCCTVHRCRTCAAPLSSIFSPLGPRASDASGSGVVERWEAPTHRGCSRQRKEPLNIDLQLYAGEHSFVQWVKSNSRRLRPLTYPTELPAHHHALL